MDNELRIVAINVLLKIYWQTDPEGSAASHYISIERKPVHDQSQSMYIER